MRRAAQLTTIVAAAALLIVPGSPAQAYVSQVDVSPTTITDSSTGEGSIAATMHLSMQAGEARNLRAELVMGNARAEGQPSPVAAAQKITCEPAGGATLPGEQIWNTRNLLADEPDVTLMTRMLFVAPAAGSYDCHLRVYLNNELSHGRETAAMRGGFLGDVSGAIPADRTARLIRSGSDATYFALGAPVRQLHHVAGYTPPVGATSFRVVGDLQTSSCYGNGGNACPTATYPAGAAAKIYTRVVATPSIPSASCTSQASAPRSVTVSKQVHHLRIHNELLVTLPSSGCGTWTLNVVARDDGGSLPFVVHTGDGPYTTVYARPA
jgi:hypothetical protein